MIRLDFTNAIVSDTGLGVVVNGTSLDTMISTALGTRAKDKWRVGDGLKEFYSNACNVTVIIDPQPVTTVINDGEHRYRSIEDMEEKKYEQYKKGVEKTNTEI